MRTLGFSGAGLLIATLLAGCSAWPREVAPETRAAVTRPVRDVLAPYLDGLRQLVAALPDPANGDDPGDRLALVAARARGNALVRDAEAARRLLAAGEPTLGVIESLKNHRAQHLAPPWRVLELAEDQRNAGAAFGARFTQPERKLWEAAGGPGDLLGDELLVPYLERRSALFDRKYFHDPDDQGGNFIEGWLNSRLAWFRSAQIGDPGWEASAGVSPWEGIARLEPIGSLDGQGSLGMMAALGTTYHFFPAAGATESGAPRAEEGGLLADWLQRAGLRAGVGVSERDGETVDLLLGAGVQLRSLTVWGLWNPEEDEFSVGFGAADFRWVTEALTVFE